MNDQAVDTGWQRLLEKIRKLFEVPPQKNPAAKSRRERVMLGNADMRGLLGPHRSHSR
jgi:hypothetical protein